MKISVIVHANPTTSQGAASALQFCRAAIKNGHQIAQVFFYRDGVSIANSAVITPQDETNLQQQWIELAATHHIALITCIASAARRGLHNENESERHDMPTTLTPEFELAGLGDLVTATLSSDRTVSFGG